MDDRRLGLVIRALRRRRGWRQEDLATEAGVSQGVVSRLELGRISDVSVPAARAVTSALDARLAFDLTWRGAAVDRLLDDRHAALVDAVVRLLGTRWEVIPEWSFAHFGERGSIDLLAWHAPTATLLIVEVKTEIASIEETLRKLDTKARLAPILVPERGWRPRVVARLLVVADSGAARRAVGDRAATFQAALPQRGWQVRRWLREPAGPMSGVLFLPLNNVATSRRTGGGSHRVRRPARSAGAARQLPGG